MTIPPQTGCAFPLLKGQTLVVQDPVGQQVADLSCFDLHEPANAFSAGRTLDFADTLYITKGHRLYSARCDAFLTITEDTCGRHDLLLPPCSLRMFQLVEGSAIYHPSCHENLSLALNRFGILADTIQTTFNIFMNVEVLTTGEIRIAPPISKAGDCISLRAERDLIIGLTACSHEETNAGCCKSISYFIEAPGF